MLGTALRSFASSNKRKSLSACTAGGGRCGDRPTCLRSAVGATPLRCDATSLPYRFGGQVFKIALIRMMGASTRAVSTEPLGVSVHGFNDPMCTWNADPLRAKEMGVRRGGADARGFRAHHLLGGSDAPACYEGSSINN